MRRASSLLFLLCVLLPAAADAQSAADRRRAGTLFREGESLFTEERWSEALAKFEESYETVAHVATRFNVAKCLEKLGRLSDADAAYAEVEAGDDEDLSASAREGRARIASQMATIRVTAAEGEAVTISGDACPSPCERRVAPGSYEVVLGTGDDAYTARVTVAAGETKAIGRPGTEDAEVDESEPDFEPDFDVSTEGFATGRLLLWGGTAVAAVGLTMTLVFGLRANAFESEVKDARLSGPDPDDVDSGQAAATLANVGIVVALVGAGCAVTGFILSMDDDEDHPDEASARIDVVPGGLVLSGVFP